MKEYLTVASETKSELIIKKSVFITRVYPLETEEEAQCRLEAVRKEEYRANHNCYAYVLGDHCSQLKCSDDGEPSGTAGRPILAVLQHMELTNLLVIVTRYFGGVKLGANGLVRAYGQSASQALAGAAIIKRQPSSLVQFALDYSFLGKLKAACGEKGYGITDTVFADNVLLTAQIPTPEREAFLARIYDISSGTVSPKSITEILADVPWKGKLE